MKHTARAICVFVVALLVTISVPSFAQSSLYPLPASWSFRALANWAQPRIASGSELPAPGSVGDLFNVTNGVKSTLYRYESPEFGWVKLGGSGGIARNANKDDVQPSPDDSEYTVWISSNTAYLATLNATGSWLSPRGFSADTLIYENVLYYTLADSCNTDLYLFADSNASTAVNCTLSDGYTDIYLRGEDPSTNDPIKFPKVDFFTVHFSGVASTIPTGLSLYGQDVNSPPDVLLYTIASLPSPVPWGSFTASGSFGDGGLYDTYYLRLHNATETEAEIAEWYFGTILPATHTWREIGRDLVIPPQISTPTAPAEGQLWYDSNVNQIKVWNGTAWTSL